MKNKFQNKYRIPSARLQSWDYGSDGYYFITICTAGMEHFFGEIHNGEMNPNKLGQFANSYWEEIPLHFPFVELGNFVIMPNHVHGILIIDKPVGNVVTLPDVETPKLGVSNIAAEHSDVSNNHQTPKLGGTNYQTPKLGGTNHQTPKLGGTNHQTPKLGVSTDETTDARKQTIAASEKWKPATIGVIINQFKRKVTIDCRTIQPRFAWQSRFHDHIIRDAQSFENIQNYIEINPQNWGKDKFYRNSL